MTAVGREVGLDVVLVVVSNVTEPCAVGSSAMASEADVFAVGQPVFGNDRILAVLGTDGPDVACF